MTQGRPQPTADPTLRALVDTLVPADETASGWQAGVGSFLSAILEGDAADRAPLVDAGLMGLDAEAVARGAASFAALDGAARTALLHELQDGVARTPWAVPPGGFLDAVVVLTMQGYYGGPGSTGSVTPESWRSIGYRPLPEGARWPDLPYVPPPTIGWDALADSYDAIVVGAGAGGGVAACVLSEAGMRVLLVERGPWLTPHDLPQDHLRNQRNTLPISGGYDTPAGPPSEGNPRVSVDTVVGPADGRWGNNAMTVGGGTRVYGAQAWRFCPEDFAMASTYGVPEGSSLADWPISYDDLAPAYDWVEWELGVSGDPSGNAYAGARTRGYPMPPVPANGSVPWLRRGAEALGLGTSPVPMLINSVPYNGRGACIACSMCVGFGCPGEFKTDSRNSVIQRAVATGRCDVLTDTVVESIVTGPTGDVVGVALVNDDLLRRQVTADRVVLAAGAVETARLLLNSASDREPNGLGNNTDQVGRNLQAHVYAGAFGIFDEPVQDCVGPGPSIATNDFRHHNDGVVGGGMLANDFVLTPLQAWSGLVSLGVMDAWGAAGKRGMRELYSRLSLVTGPIQEMPNPDSRVTVDPEVRDRYGVPVARLTGSLHPEDDASAEFLRRRAVAWLEASGARTVIPTTRGIFGGPSVGQHQAGTCRMGTDPASSVTDAWGTVWGHDNLHIVDASLHVTNGGVNPVLTILALAYRVSTALAADWAGGMPRSAVRHSGPTS